MDDYAEMFEAQSGLCEICGEPSDRVLCVDHDHMSGSVRGLLCDNCNKGLGNFYDNVSLMASAIKYIEKYKCA
jgi:hypothetical protein